MLAGIAITAPSIKNIILPRGSGSSIEKPKKSKKRNKGPNKKTAKQAKPIIVAII